MSSKRRIRRRSCEEKKAFEHREQAIRCMINMPYLTGRIGVYQCALCGKWHIGHMKLARRDQRTRYKRGADVRL